MDTDTQLARGFLLAKHLETDLREVITKHISPSFKGNVDFLDQGTTAKAYERMIKDLHGEHPGLEESKNTPLKSANVVSHGSNGQVRMQTTGTQGNSTPSFAQ